MFWTYAMVIVNFNRNPILPKKVTPSYYFEYLSLKNMNFMGSGRLCLFWEGVGVNKIFLATLRFCVLLYLKVIEQWFFGH